MFLGDRTFLKYFGNLSTSHIAKYNIKICVTQLNLNFRGNSKSAF